MSILSQLKNPNSTKRLKSRGSTLRDTQTHREANSSSRLDINNNGGINVVNIYQSISNVNPS
jgi:ABC-type tungstate transport system permease subunit